MIRIKEVYLFLCCYIYSPLPIMFKQKIKKYLVNDKHLKCFCSHHQLWRDVQRELHLLRVKLSRRRWLFGQDLSVQQQHLPDPPRIHRLHHLWPQHLLCQCGQDRIRSGGSCRCHGGAGVTVPH